MHYLVVTLQEDTIVTAEVVAIVQVVVIATIAMVGLTLDFDNLSNHAV